MRFDKDILEKTRADAKLRFWGREIGAEAMKATQGTSRTAQGLLAMLGVGVSQEDAQSVAEQLIQNDFQDLISRAPGIEPYFRRRETAVDRYLEEVVNTVNAHEEQITRELLRGKRPTRVLSMDQAGFSYHGARSALIISTDAGKFLYKPHPMRYSALFAELCEQLLPGKVHVPLVIDCGDACICEFIESVPPANDEELDAYYNGLGGYLALAYFLSLTDQHADNILPMGRKLAPIDVETLLLSSPSIEGGAPEPDDPALIIRGSVVFTAMLSYDKDRLNGSIVAGSKGRGITPISTSTEVIDHLDAVEKGFAEAFLRCLQNKRMLCDAIRSLADVDLRILMGPGNFYQGLQSRFFKLEEWDEAQRLQDMDSILRSTRFKRANEAVFEYERTLLVEHDIPYFTIKAGETSLRADGELIRSDYLSESPIDTAIRHVEEIDEADLEWELGLLRKVVHGMPLMSKTRVPDIQQQGEPLTQDDALEEAGRILQRLFDARIDCGQGRYAIMAFGKAAGSHGPMDASLGWGYAGVGAFAAACMRCGAGDQEMAQELVDLCLDEIARNCRYLRMCPEILSTPDALSLNSGVAGQLRALQLMQTATRSDKAQQVHAGYLSLLDMVNHPSIASQPAYGPQGTSTPRDAVPPLQSKDDLIGGNAGAVEQLLASGQMESAGQYLAAMVARRQGTGNYIHKGAWRVPYFDPTLFHGATGVGYELLRYARPDVVEPLCG